MSSLFGGKSREDREAEQQQQQQRQQSLARQFEPLVTRALEQLTRWAFPDSQVEYNGAAAWSLWHNADDGQKYVDVTVTVEFNGDTPEYFECQTQNHSDNTDSLTREDLNDTLRWVICRS